MENNKKDVLDFMEREVDPYTLVHDVAVNWWVILLGALAAAMLTFVTVNVRYVPK